LNWKPAKPTRISPVMLASPMFRIGTIQTALPPKWLFNNLVLELGTSYAFQGRNFNACSERSPKQDLGWSTRAVFQAPDLSVGC
jgi:hypothetical protein